MTAPPRTIGKYEIRGEIGSGACGVVYKAWDPFVAREVAVKVARRGGAGESPAATAHDRAFFVEARAAGMLAHPHIVSLFDAGVEGELSYLVMEYVDGDTLAPLCRREAPRAPLEQVVEIVFKCAKALDYAHGRGVLHRDLKPSNIMLTRNGVPKIMDFSIAQITGQGGSAVAGTPLYMPPEQVRGEPPGPPGDLYSLGAVLFHLLTGEPPFAAAEIPVLFRTIKTQPAPRLESRRADLPKPLADVVGRLLLKDPAARFQSGRELAAALARIFDRLRVSDAALTRREDRDALHRLHFFDGFSDEEIDEILNASQLATYAPETPIVREGESDNAFYILARGEAEVRKGGKPLHRLGKGDCFGEIGFLTAARRTASVVATSQALALRVNAALLDQVSRDCQLRFYKVFAETLIYRLTVTSAKLSAAS